MLIDMHVHTTISGCSELPLRRILDCAKDRGLDGVCIMDHDNFGAANQFTPGFQPDGLLALVGQEYYTPQGDFLLLGPGSDLPPGLRAAEMLSLVQAAGGIAIAAHPCRPQRSLDISLALQGLVPALEGINGRSVGQSNRLAMTWARRLGLPMVGGSDAHCLDELGRVVTRFDDPISSEAELCAAIKAGRCAPLWGPCHLP